MEPIIKSKVSSRNSRGIYLVASVAILATLMLLAVLLIGVGFRSSDKVLLRNHANLLSLAAMQEFVTQPISLPYTTRANRALARAQHLLNENTLKGIKSRIAADPNTGMGRLKHVGDTTSGNVAGEIEFGKWHEKKPPTTPPCGASDANYPCFIPNIRIGASPPPAADETANAVRVTLRNQAENPILASFVGNLGSVEETSYAIMVPRCLAALMDLSYSVVSQTHATAGTVGYTSAGGHPALPEVNVYAKDPYVWNPDTTVSYPAPHTSFPFPAAGLFVVPTRYSDAGVTRSIAGETGASAGSNPITTGCSDSIPSDCSSLFSFIDGSSPRHWKGFYASLYRCNMQKFAKCRNSSNSNLHFWSDYELETRPASLGGPVLVDKLVVPQPFTRFLGAMNSALQLIKNTSTQGDKAFLGGFTGKADFTSRVPAPDGSYRPDGVTEDRVTDPNNLSATLPMLLTSEIDYLIQLTNPNNIGPRYYAGLGNYPPVPLTSRTYPNYISIGMFPIYSKDQSESATNLIAALLKSALALGEDRSINPSACESTAQRSIIVATDGMVTCAPHPLSPPLSSTTHYNAYDCANDYIMYQRYENRLETELRQFLLDRKISVTVLIDSDAIDPHIFDYADPTVSPTNGTVYLTMEELRARGYGINLPANRLFDETPVCPAGVTPCNDTVAFQAVSSGTPGYKFRRPLTTLGKLALSTGGLICPLMRQCNSPGLDCPACPGSCYQDDPNGGPSSPQVLKDCARPSSGGRRNCSYINGNPAEQAAHCATQAVGGNPFALRVPISVVP